jgi:hypothetical protein
MFLIRAKINVANYITIVRYFGPPLSSRARDFGRMKGKGKPAQTHLAAKLK